MDELMSPAVSLQDSMRELDIDPELQAGITVLKVTTGGAMKTRILTISGDKMALFITHAKIKQKDAAAAYIASTLPIPLFTLSKGFRFSSSTSLTDRYIRHIDASDLDGWQTGALGTIKFENAKARDPKRDWDKLTQQTLTIFHHGNESLDFIIENEKHRVSLVKALERIYKQYHLEEQGIGNDSLLLRHVWYDIDTDKNAMISEKEFLKICDRINLELNNPKQKFSDFIKSHKISRKQLVYGECKALLQSIKSEMTTSVCNDLWMQLFGDDFRKGVSVDVLLKKFLVEAQGEKDATIKDARNLLSFLKAMDMDNFKEAGSAELLLDFDPLNEYLLSTENDAYDPKAREATPKLNMPISYYWINTSHNTYLTGDQLRSRSSVEAYVKSLLRGCKCVELDCWDGDVATNKAVVYHGFTLTSKILFRSICLVVKNYLDANPKTYPIILSLENHCSHPFQRVMAQDMEEIFGSKLFIPSEEQIGISNLPSPEELRGMIVIKGKRPPELDDNPGEDGEEDPTEDPYSDQYNEPPAAAAKKDPKKLPKVVSELSRLTLFHGNKFKNFENSLAQNPSHMHSFGESKITKIVNKDKANANFWREYNITHMSRTYPAGLRVDSSNYSPVLAWSMGCQLVALNFQTADTPLLLNDGRFRQGGGCGYLPKPQSTMEDRKFDEGMILKVKVMQANCLPKPRGVATGERIDPYVKVEIHDANLVDGKDASISTSFSTLPVNNNGFCPVWNDVSMDFQVYSPDVAMLLFKIIDEDIGTDQHIASAAIPVSCLRKGYRSVQLYDPHSNTRTGPFLFSSLLVHIEY